MLNEQDIPWIEERNRVKYYYDKFKYRVSVPLKGAHYFRDSANNSDVYRNLNKTVFHYYSSNSRHDTVVNILRNQNSSVGETKVLKVFAAIFKFDKRAGDFTYRVSSDQIDVYTNKLELVQALGAISDNVRYRMSGYKSDYEQGVIYLSKPKNKYRLYLKWKKIPEIEVEDLYNFLHFHECRMSPRLQSTFKRFKNNKHIYTHDLHFVDYDEETFLTLYSLKYPDLISKVCRIEKR